MGYIFSAREAAHEKPMSLVSRRVPRLDRSYVYACVRAGEREEASGSVPVHELKAILNVARKQYLEMIDSTLPSVASCLTERLEEAASSGSGKTETIQQQFDSTGPELDSEWEDAPAL